MEQERSPGVSVWQQTQFLQNIMIAERDFLWNFDTINLTASSNTSTKFHQNSTHSYRDIGFKSRTDRQSRGERERGTDNWNWGHSKDCDDKSFGKSCKLAERVQQNGFCPKKLSKLHPLFEYLDMLRFKFWHFGSFFWQ